MKYWKFTLLLSVGIVVSVFPQPVNAGTFSFALQSTGRRVVIDYEGTGTITHMNSPQDPPTPIDRGRTSLEDINVLRATDLRVSAIGNQFTFSFQIGQPGKTFAGYRIFFPVFPSDPLSFSGLDIEHHSIICSQFFCEGEAVLSLNPTETNQLQALIDTHGTDNLFLAGEMDRFTGFAAFSVFSALTQVDVDVKPGSLINSVNPNSRGVIPVAILTTSTFDASTVDWTLVSFGVTGMETAPVHAAYEDVDADGDVDLILHFKTRDTDVGCGVSKVFLRGSTVSGQLIGGRDEVVTVGCR